MMKQAKVGLSIALLLAVVLSFSACKEEETAVANRCMTKGLRLYL